MIRTLIVDDEPLARERLRTLAAAKPGIEIIGECPDGNSALEAIREQKPDLVFLDVQMPEMDGLAVIAALSDINLPVVIFVTAFDQYAIRAFDVCALDYLLKPFDRQRFDRALDRGIEECERRDIDAWNKHLRSLLTEMREGPKYTERLVIRSGGRVFFLRVNELDWIEAAGNYVRLHCGRENYLHRESLTNLEKTPESQAVRAHSSLHHRQRRSH